jgi:XTP/dITP diphosphohydrolase
LYCATGNPGKLREFQMAAEGHELRMAPARAPYEETGATFEENAILKARHYGPHVPGLLFADDSGLEVDGLGGAPGVHSARFSGAGLGPAESIDEANNRLLLEKLHGVENRTARFVCVIALVDGTRLIGTFRGVVEGWITDAPRGSNGFGYDPLFYYAPFGCTFGEAAAERKLAVSHRGHALRAMLEALR